MQIVHCWYWMYTNSLNFTFIVNTVMNMVEILHSKFRMNLDTCGCTQILILYADKLRLQPDSWESSQDSWEFTYDSWKCTKVNESLHRDFESLIGIFETKHRKSSAQFKHMVFSQALCLHPTSCQLVNDQQFPWFSWSD